ncbi:MAG: WecB/TagA/CpsF family glycosyltransferase [Cyanobacteriota bacterium]
MKTSEYLEKKRINVLGYPVDVVDKERSLEIVKENIKNNKQLHIITLNPEMIINAQKNEELSNAIYNSELVIPDGSGILLAFIIKGIKSLNTVPGIELAEDTIEYCSENQLEIALLGATEEVSLAVKERLENKYPGIKIVYRANGYFTEEENIAKNIAAKTPRLLLVALGVPKQEIWIHRNKNLFPNTIIIGVGGSFDVWSGKVKRAPAFFRTLKIEWLYRLVKEPFRAKRILFALPYYTIQLLFDSLRSLLSIKMALFN